MLMEKCCWLKTAALPPAVKIQGIWRMAARSICLSSGVAQAGSAAASRMDLLTVVLHEMGHFDGWTELDPASYPDALKALTLGTGQRRTQDIDAVFAARLYPFVDGAAR